jgi:hypothetical protein
MTLARAMFEFSLVINPVKLERAVFVKRSFVCSYLNMIFSVPFYAGFGRLSFRETLGADWWKMSRGSEI